MFPSRRTAHRAAITTLTMTLAVLGAGVAPGSARADTAPAPTTPPTPATAAAAALPTWQIDGVAWSQVVIGTTVYVTGNFTSARPPGVAVGGAGQIRAGHLLAYDIRTGQRIASFDHTLNAQGLVVRASPDRKRLYVGGDFTTVDGKARSHLAVFDVATGALLTDFQPSLSGQVRAIAVTADTVYVGGQFEGAQGLKRRRLAAFSAADGSLLSWAPSADDGYVWSLLIAPAGDKVIAAGAFRTISGQRASGTAALDLSSGTLKPWAMNTKIFVGSDSAITNLSTDGTSVYGGGYVFGQNAPLEGTFSADPADGTLRWVADCLGDTYDTKPLGGVVYVAGHAHDCSVVGGHPDSYDAVGNRNRWQHATAYTTQARGRNRTKDAYGNDFTDTPAPQPLHWYPQLGIGTVTGQYQAAWSVDGTDGYVAMSGEFPSVNGTPQQGLTRFAAGANITATAAPSFQSVPARTVTAPVATVADSIVTVTHQSAWDMDNATLTYELVRDRGTAQEQVVATSRSTTNFWTLPQARLQDVAPPTGAHSYTVKVSDPTGQVTYSQVSNAVTVTTRMSAYPAAVLRDGASHYWRLGQGSGNAVDLVGGLTGTLARGVTRGTAGALTGDTDTAMTFNGSINGRISTGSTKLGGGAMSAELWMKSTSTTGGRLLTFQTTSGNNTVSERHIYLTAAGTLGFNPDASGKTLGSAKKVSTGEWVHVVATVGAGGMKLYADGETVATDTTVTATPAATGTWSIGADRSGSRFWPTTWAYRGALDEVATYDRELSADQVAVHHQLGRGVTPNVAPAASFTAEAAHLDVSLDAAASTDTDGKIASYAWDFGDDSPRGTGVTARHSYTAAGTYQVTLRVTDDAGATATTTRTVTVTDPVRNQDPNASFTAQAENLDVSLDAAASTDTDGKIASYAWDFGDDSPSATGVTARHSYAAAGTYQVTLRVTDDAGATATTTRTVTVTESGPAPAPAPVIASDAFSRTMSGGWGKADVGGSWSLSGDATAFGVAAGAGTVQVAPSTGPAAMLRGATGTDTEVTTSFSADQQVTGGGLFTSVMARGDVLNGYGARVWIDKSATMRLYSTRTVAGAVTDTDAVATGLTYEPGATYLVKVRVTGIGTTRSYAKVWKQGETEPQSWTLDATDTTASLQKAGAVGVSGYLSKSATLPIRLSIGAFTATAVGKG